MVKRNKVTGFYGYEGTGTDAAFAQVLNYLVAIGCDDDYVAEVTDNMKQYEGSFNLVESPSMLEEMLGEDVRVTYRMTMSPDFKKVTEDSAPGKFEDLELGFIITPDEMPIVLISYTPEQSGLIYINSSTAHPWLEAIAPDGNIGILNPKNPFTTPIAGYLHIDGLLDHTTTGD